jgi:hypothetical protein
MRSCALPYQKNERMMQRIRTTPFQTHWQWGKYACALIFCAFFLLGALALPRAASAAIQEIRVLAVVKERNSRVAMDNAIAYAKQRAVYLLARKMDIPDVAAKLQVLRPDQWQEMIRGATVLQSKRELDMTYADISVAVVEEALHRALEKHLSDTAVAPTPIDHVKTVSGVLVLPVYITPARPYLWETENLLRVPLSWEMLRQSRGVAMLPAGDFEDLRLVDYKNALSVTSEELSAMFTRYGAGEIIIAIVTPSERGTLDPTNILLRRMTPEGMHVEEMNLPPRDETEPLAERIEDAASAIAGAAIHIATATSEKEQELIQKSGHLSLVYVYTNPRELATLQTWIRETEGVVYLATPLISLERTEGEMAISKPIATVLENLKKRGVYTKADGSRWQISLRAFDAAPTRANASVEP